MTKFDILIIFTGILCLNVMPTYAEEAISSKVYLKHELDLVEDLTKFNSDLVDVISIKLNALNLLRNRMVSFVNTIRKSGVRKDFIEDAEFQFTLRFNPEHLDIPTEYSKSFDDVKRQLDQSKNVVASIAEEMNKQPEGTDENLFETEILRQKYIQQVLVNKLAILENHDLFLAHDDFVKNLEKYTTKFEERKKIDTPIDACTDFTTLNKQLRKQTKDNGAYLFTWGRRVDFYRKAISFMVKKANEFSELINKNTSTTDSITAELISEANEAVEYIVYVDTIISEKLTNMFEKFNKAQVLNDITLLKEGELSANNKTEYSSLKIKFDESNNLYKEALGDFEYSDISKYIRHVIERFSAVIELSNRLDYIVKEEINKLNEKNDSHNEELINKQKREEMESNQNMRNQGVKKERSKTYSSKVSCRRGWRLALIIVSSVVGSAALIFVITYAVFCFRRRRLVNNANLIV